MPKSANPLDRFSIASNPVKNRIIGASFGFPGTGKTSFWFGAPGPIVLFSFNLGHEGVIEEYQDKKEIRLVEAEWLPGSEEDDEEKMQNDAKAIRDQFEEDYAVAIQHARTVIVDLETDLWEIYRYAEFGRPSDNPKDYAKLNQRYRRFINQAKATDVNLGLIQGMKEAWGAKVNQRTGARGAAASGVFERAGFKELEGLVHVNIEHRRVKVPGEKSRFEIEVGKSRGPGSREVQDQTFEADPNTAFLELALQIFPDTSAEDWE